MSKIEASLQNVRLLDTMARGRTDIHKRHPVAKLLTTLVYLLVVISFDKYAIGRLMPLVLYPVVVAAYAELPFWPLLKRLLMVEPLIIGIGILNPIFDKNTFPVAGLTLSMGWLTFLSIVVKSGLTVMASLLLVATTEMEKLGSALRILRVPKQFVLQLLLTYRYISVLMEELFRMYRAYSLRAPRQKGVNHSAWGPFAGQLILRTFDRAQRIYQAMVIRGFKGEYRTGTVQRLKKSDWVYMLGWSAFFILIRVCDIPQLLGSLLIGVIR